METRLIEINDLSTADQRAWQELAGRAIEPNPYFEPDFLLLAGRHFEGFSKTTLVVAQEGDAFRAVLPMVDIERPRMPPRPTITTRGHPTAISGLCTPLVDRTCPDEAIGALLDELSGGARRRKLPGILSIKRIDDDGPVAESIRRAARTRGLPVFTKNTWLRGTVKRNGSWEQPLDRKRRQDINRLRRVIERETGIEPRIVDRTPDPTAVDDFLMMEASGWKGVGHGSAFARDPDKIAWFREWRDQWVMTGRLILLALHIEDTPLAMQCFVRAGDGLFFFRMAYDARYRKYSPGAMLLASAKEYLHDRTDAEWIDTCADRNNDFVLEMFPEGRPLSMVLIGTGRLIDRGFIAALPAMTRLVTTAHQARARRSQAKTVVR